MTRLTPPIFDQAHPKFFDQLLIHVNSTQNASYQAISLICSADMVDWKILQSDWLRIYWSISRGQKFPQIWDLCSNTANNINFHCRTNSVKIIKFFNKFKKPCFWSIFQLFQAKEFFSRKCESAMHNFMCVSGIMSKFRKN